MNKNKILLISILTIFIIGISISCVSASSTIHAKDVSVSSISANSIQNSSSDVNSLKSSDTVTFNCTYNNAKAHGGVVKVTLTKDEIREVAINWDLISKRPDDKYRYYDVNYFKKIKKYKIIKKPVYKYKTINVKSKYYTVYKNGRYLDKALRINRITGKPNEIPWLRSVYTLFYGNAKYTFKTRYVPKTVKYFDHYKKIKKPYYVDSKPYTKRVKCYGSATVTPGSEDYKHISIEVRYVAPDLKGYDWHMAYGFQTGGFFEISKLLSN